MTFIAQRCSPRSGWSRGRALLAPLAALLLLGCAPVPQQGVTLSTPPASAPATTPAPSPLPASAPARSEPRAETRPGPVIASTRRDPREQAEGDRAHPQVLRQLGGVYDNPAVQDHVERIGRRLVAVSEQPRERWTFTVLDSPDVNAFAIPGGYVYVTRALVALANDEASLAGVIGHEIGHVTAAHGAERRQRQSVASVGVLLGTVGLAAVGLDPTGIGDLLSTAAAGGLASYSRDDEREADQLGIRYLAAAGYDPMAQAEFLDTMGRNAALEAAIEGRRYDPNQTSFFSTHPATAGRVREARAFAQQFPSAGIGERARGRHLAAIDGIAWGPSADEGFLRDGRFVHPTLGFSFDVPRGYRLLNRPRNVVLAGRDGSGMVFDGGRATAPDPLTYLTESWAPALQRSGQMGRLGAVRSGAPNGLPLALATAPARVDGRNYTIQLTVVEHEGRFFRFTALLPPGSRSGPALSRATQSFRALSEAERRALAQSRVDIVRVRPGTSEEALAAEMRVGDRPVDLFRVINDRRAGQALTPGEAVKIIR